jgi:hypothetical protein
VQNTWLSIGGVVLALILGVSGRARAEGGVGDRSEEDSGPARLELQVRYLSAALAAAWSEVDALRARLDGKILGSAPAAVPGDGMARLLEGGARVREANRELGLVVLDAGARQGVRAGLVLMVMRDKQPLARVRVVDVRRRVAGAVIEELSAGAPYPGPGDRLVVMTDGK